jgi:hypothetical protein
MKLLSVCFCLAAFLSAEARVFTDDQGRTVDADLRGVRGGNVGLGMGGINGQWPLNKLSKADQVYVTQWVQTHTAVKHVLVQVTEKDGVGDARELKEERAKPGPPPPFAPPVEVKTAHKHYEMQIQNPGTVDAVELRVAYVIYVSKPDGSVGISPGNQRIASLAAGKATRVTTEGISVEKTKSTQLKLRVSNQTAIVSERKVRSYEEFGGVWVRVLGPDGTQVAEYKKLSSDIEKLNPPWQEAEVKEDIPVLQNLGDLLELVKKLAPPVPPVGPR